MLNYFLGGAWELGVVIGQLGLCPLDAGTETGMAERCILPKVEGNPWNAMPQATLCRLAFLVPGSTMPALTFL
jgi:hypothetical protein